MSVCFFSIMAAKTLLTCGIWHRAARLRGLHHCIGFVTLDPMSTVNGLFVGPCSNTSTKINQTHHKHPVHSQASLGRGLIHNNQSNSIASQGYASDDRISRMCLLQRRCYVTRAEEELQFADNVVKSYLRELQAEYWKCVLRGGLSDSKVS